MCSAAGIRLGEPVPQVAPHAESRTRKGRNRRGAPAHRPHRLENLPRGRHHTRHGLPNREVAQVIQCPRQKRRVAA